MKWEYKFVYVDVDAEDLFNVLGQDRWELILKEHIYFVFKREVQ